MSLFLRLLRLLLTFRFHESCGALGPARKRFRVWPPDLDVLWHVNNGVYLTMLDVARADLLLRSGLFGKLWSRGWYPVVAAETIRFRRSLQLFQSFEVETQVIGWDAKALLLQHGFSRAGQVVAEAVVRVRFLKRRGGSVSTAQLLDLIGKTDPRPRLPDWIEAWNEENAR